MRSSCDRFASASSTTVKKSYHSDGGRPSRVRLARMREEEGDVAGRPGHEVLKPRGLIAVRCGPPNGSTLIYEAIGIAEWRYLTLVSISDSVKPDETADTSYPHTLRNNETSFIVAPPP